MHTAALRGGGQGCCMSKDRSFHRVCVAPGLLCSTLGLGVLEGAEGMTNTLQTGQTHSRALTYVYNFVKDPRKLMS